jgi:Flp pilus assembly protein TadD
MSLGGYDDALECFSTILKLDPNDAAAWNTKGVILEKLGRKGEAYAAYAKAKELGYIG